MAKPYNLTGISWHIDNNVLTNSSAETLRGLFEHGWVLLTISSTIEVEHLGATSKEDAARLEESRAPFFISFAPLVLDHSILGKSVLEADIDEERLIKVHKAIWPASNLESDRDNPYRRSMGRSRFRDSLIVAHAIRDIASALVTDDLGILSANERIQMEFPNFKVISINAATDLALARVEKVRRLAKGDTNSRLGTRLPEWP